MSAWIVSKAHIDLLVLAGTPHGPDKLHYQDGDKWVEARPENRDEIGQMLVMECVASVSYRYPQDSVEAGELPGPVEPYYVEPYTYTTRHTVLEPGEVLQLIACYEYQSCEHPGWESSAAADYCRQLFRKTAMTFATGPWGWDEETLAGRPKLISLMDMLGGDAA
jgi:hypothetical protein